MSAPLTPADCDLRDFHRMMIDIPRLRSSDFDAIPSDAAWRAGVNLWLSAWHQVPAASLSTDDTTLAKAAGLGRDLRTWKKVKADALRNWVPCDDGRIYHPTVAELALEAWLEKLQQRIASGAGNSKRWSTTFDAAPIEAEIDRCAGLLANLNPASKALAKVQRRRKGVIPPGGEPHPTGTLEASHRDDENVPDGSQGEGEGKGEGKKKEVEARGTRLPADWAPDEVSVAYALSAGFQPAQVNLMAERFRNFWLAKAGKDGVKRDWPATWRNWVLKDAERLAPTPLLSIAEKVARSNIQ